MRSLFADLPSMNQDAKTQPAGWQARLSSWLSGYDRRRETAVRPAEAPVEGAYPSPAPGVRVLHEAWKPGLRFDGFPIEEPNHDPLAQATVMFEAIQMISDVCQSHIRQASYVSSAC